MSVIYLPGTQEGVHHLLVLAQLLASLLKIEDGPVDILIQPEDFPALFFHFLVILSVPQDHDLVQPVVHIVRIQQNSLIVGSQRPV